jgi:hypothetical protein
MYVTLSLDGSLGERRAKVEAIVQRAGGTIRWRCNDRLLRSYALLEVPDITIAAEIEAETRATAYDKPVIALALSPAVPEALPSLLDALGGPGRPAGVFSCIDREGSAIVEWDPAVTAPQTIVGLVDLELARFHSGRVAELLSPLPPSVVVGIAAAGLQAPQIELGRILELRIEGD